MSDVAVHVYSTPAWSPYLVGALIGLLAVTTLAVAQNKVSASSAYANVAGMIGRLVAPRHIAGLPFFAKKKPVVGWSLVFICGAVLGSFIAASTGGEIRGSYLPDLWSARFGGDSYELRTVTALVGGMLMAFGARMTGGCTSGHGISGTMQLAVSSWISVVCFFIGGALVAIPLFRL